jgi:hypothetical protein
MQNEASITRHRLIIPRGALNKGKPTPQGILMLLSILDKLSLLGDMRTAIHH